VESLTYRVFGVALLALCFGSHELLGAGASKDLEGIKRRLESQKRGLSQLQVKEGSVLQSLRTIEDDLRNKSKDLKTAVAQQAAIVDAIRKTEIEADKLRGSISQREDLFRQRAVALYRWQRTGDPFWFFDGPGHLSAIVQRQRYLEVTLAFDRGLIADLQSQSQRQQVLKLRLDKQKDRLAAQQKVLVLARAAVAQEVGKKKTLLASLRQEKDTRLKVLREMERAAERLQKMLEDIARRSTVPPQRASLPPSTGRGLEAMLGRMDWPVKGQVSAPFGKFKHPEFATELVRKGIDIDAPLGEEVRAVEKGRVVFADRFTGYGRMVIVDHGERYYTVYAHLSEIISKTGDELRRGQILGRVGDSDSLSGAKLYFEMRKDGHSIDPLPWLRR